MDFGVISLGNHAITRVMPSIVSSGSRITHIYSRDSSKGEKISKEYGALYFGELEKFIKQPFEAVYISSPNSLHFIHTKMSLEAGKNVLLEKPVTLSINETAELSNLSKKMGLKFGVGFHLRFHPATDDVKKYLSNKSMGEARVAFGKFTSNSVSPHNGTWWEMPEMAGGGSIVGRGVHVFDSFVNLFGKDINLVKASNIPKCAIIEETMQATFEFKSGIIANALSSKVISSDANDLTIFGSEGSLVVTNFYATSVSSSIYLNNKLMRKFDNRTNMYEEEVRDFVGDFRKIAGPEEALLSTKMHLFSQESACSGKSMPTQ
ncbi:MAG: Gfo/Idh/MocA family protein [Thermoplasmata archaeon]